MMPEFCSPARPLVVSMRVGKRKDPTRRHVGLCVTALVREVEARFNDEITAGVRDCLDGLINDVVARGQWRSRAPCSAHFSGCLGAAIRLDNAIDLVWCPPMPVTAPPPAPEARPRSPFARKKTAAHHSEAKKGAAASHAPEEATGAEVVTVFVAVKGRGNEWDDWVPPPVAPPPPPPPDPPPGTKTVAAAAAPSAAQVVSAPGPVQWGTPPRRRGGSKDPSRPATPKMFRWGDEPASPPLLSLDGPVNTGGWGAPKGLILENSRGSPRGSSPHSSDGDASSARSSDVGSARGGGAGGTLLGRSNASGSAQGSPDRKRQPPWAVALRSSSPDGRGGGDVGGRSWGRGRGGSSGGGNGQQQLKRPAALSRKGWPVLPKFAGWVCVEADVVMLQRGIRGHVTRCKVRRTVAALPEPLYTKHFDFASGCQFYQCSMSDRITWQRPKLLFPKPQRSDLMLILYIQTHVRSLQARVRVSELACEVYERVPLPPSQQPKKATSDPKKKTGPSPMTAKLKSGGNKQSARDMSEPSTPLNPTAAAAAPALTADGDGGDGASVASAGSSLGSSLTTQPSEGGGGAVVVSRQPSKSGDPSPAASRAPSKPPSRQPSRQLSAAMENFNLDSGEPTSPGSPGPGDEGEGGGDDDEGGEGGAGGEEGDDDGVLYFFYNPRTGRSSLDPPKLLHEKNPRVLKVQGGGPRPKRKKYGLQVQLDLFRFDAADAKAKADAEKAAERAQRKEASKAAKAAEKEAAAALSRQPSTADGAVAAPAGSKPESANGSATGSAAGSANASAAASRRGSKEKKPKPRKLSKAEKIKAKASAEALAATGIQALWRQVRSQRRTGLAMLRRPARYRRAYDSEFKRHFFTHVPTGRVTWDVPRPLWGLKPEAFVPVPTPLESAVAGARIAVARLAGGVASALGLKPRKVPVAPEPAAPPPLEVKILVRKFGAPSSSVAPLPLDAVAEDEAAPLDASGNGGGPEVCDSPAPSATPPATSSAAPSRRGSKEATQAGGGSVDSSSVASATSKTSTPTAPRPPSSSAGLEPRRSDGGAPKALAEVNAVAST